MADFNVFWVNKNADAGVVGTGFNAGNMGLVHPSVNSMYDQFIVPIADNPRGFVFKGSTYIKMLLPQDGGGYDHFVFGSDADVTVAYAEQRLDTGITFQPGRDDYIYLCYTVPDEEQKTAQANLIISLNSTFPQGYNADTSRKIGGFHALCASVGTIAGHPLNGFNAGDILPASFWCLTHRPTCQPEGMAYIAPLDFWADIYLQSGSGANTKSVNGGTTSDSQPYSQHIEDLFLVGKTPLSDEEFQCAAEGSNQKTNIQGSADPVTTGGHVDTAGRRMISNYGLEDCCGALWQWLSGWGYGSNQTAGYVADPAAKALCTRRTLFSRAVLGLMGRIAGRGVVMRILPGWPCIRLTAAGGGPLEGKKIRIEEILNLEIMLLAYKMKESKYQKTSAKDCLTIQFVFPAKPEEKHVVFTGSNVLIDQMKEYGDRLPFLATIKKIDRYFTLS